MRGSTAYAIPLEAEGLVSQVVHAVCLFKFWSLPRILIAYTYERDTFQLEACCLCQPFGFFLLLTGFWLGMVEQEVSPRTLIAFLYCVMEKYPKVWGTFLSYRFISSQGSGNCMLVCQSFAVRCSVSSKLPSACPGGRLSSL